MLLSRSPLLLRQPARPRSTLHGPSCRISSKLQHLPSNRSIQTFAWTRRPKTNDLARSKIPQGVAIVRANLPCLGSSSRIITRRPFFGRGSQRPQYTIEADTPRKYTAGVIGICSVTFLAYWVARYRWEMRGNREPLRSILQNFICSMDNIKAGRWWVVLTSSFQHYSFIHFIIDMPLLWSIGRRFIYKFGVPAFVWTWVISAVTGSACSLYWDKSTNSDNRFTIGGTGCSPALFGLIFAEIAFNPYAPFGMTTASPLFPIWRLSAFWLGASLYGLFSDVLPEYDHAGHLGGMAGGLAVSFLCLRGRVFPR